jgi:hypothetical protein
LTTEASVMSIPMISLDTTNAISSQELPAGPSPSNSPDGLTTGKCGQVRRLVSRTAEQANSSALPILGIYGPNSFASFATVGRE